MAQNGLFLFYQSNLPTITFYYLINAILYHFHYSRYKQSLHQLPFFSFLLNLSCIFVLLSCYQETRKCKVLKIFVCHKNIILETPFRNVQLTTSYRKSHPINNFALLKKSVLIHLLLLLRLFIILYKQYVPTS